MQLVNSVTTNHTDLMVTMRLDVVQYRHFFASVIVVMTVAISSLLMAPSAVAQYALGDGRALDANPAVGGNRFNSQKAPFKLNKLNNAIVTGNVSGGKQFRGSVGYSAPGDFRGITSGSTFFTGAAEAFSPGLIQQRSTFLQLPGLANLNSDRNVALYQSNQILSRPNTGTNLASISKVTFGNENFQIRPSSTLNMVVNRTRPGTKLPTYTSLMPTSTLAGQALSSNALTLERSKSNLNTLTGNLYNNQTKSTQSETNLSSSHSRVSTHSPAKAQQTGRYISPLDRKRLIIPDRGSKISPVDTMFDSGTSNVGLNQRLDVERRQTLPGTSAPTTSPIITNSQLQSKTPSLLLDSLKSPFKPTLLPDLPATTQNTTVSTDPLSNRRLPRTPYSANHNTQSGTADDAGTPLSRSGMTPVTINRSSNNLPVMPGQDRYNDLLVSLIAQTNSLPEPPTSEPYSDHMLSALKDLHQRLSIARRTSRFSEDDFEHRTVKPLSDNPLMLPAIDALAQVELPALTSYAGTTQSRFDQKMAAGQFAIADGKYFDAEQHFGLALAFVPNHPLAQAGRIHAQLGSGLYRSAAYNLRSLFTDHPEIIIVRYSPQLIPDAKRLEKLLNDLVTTPTPSISTDAFPDAALVRAYVARLLDQPDVLSEALQRLFDQTPEDTLLPRLQAAWLHKDVTEIEPSK